MWERIDKRVRPRKRRLLNSSPSMQRWAIAAAVALLGIVLGTLGLQDAPPVIAANDAPKEQIIEESYTPELAEIESYYHAVIEDQQNQLVSFQQEGIALDNNANLGLDQLQHMYKELQQELAYGEDKDAVVKAMIENLMMQMDILRQQLMILENIKAQRNEQEKEVHL